MKTFARRLTDFRQENQWTNAGLADYLAGKVGADISVRTVENWICGRFVPHRTWRKQLEEAIRCRV